MDAFRARVVIILGAGASAHTGAPLMNDFLDRSRELYAARKLDHIREDCETVFRWIGELQRVHSKSTLDINNIETLFTTLELIEKLPQVRSKFSMQGGSPTHALKSLIVQTIQHSAAMTVRKKDELGNLASEETDYSRLGAYINKVVDGRCKFDIISFNYDVALEMGLSANDISPEYLSSYPAFVHIHKPHGSINFFAKGNTFESVRMAPKKGVMPVYYPNIMEETRSSILGANSVEQPLIVPPTWNKLLGSEGLVSVWENAARALSEATHIFVCGYSLPDTDSFFKNFFSVAAVGENPLREFVVYDPAPANGLVDQRFRNILGVATLSRYEYVSRPFVTATWMMMKRLERVTGVSL